MVPYMATPEQNARFPCDNDWIRRQAAAGGWLSVADLQAAVARPDRPDLLGDTVDRLHPSPAGYRTVADRTGQ
jgi:lysophospholipase L1-like esterase